MSTPPFAAAALIVRPHWARQVLAGMGTGCLTILAALLLILGAVRLFAGDQGWIALLIAGLFTAGLAVLTAVTLHVWLARPLLAADQAGVWVRSFRRRNGRFLRWEDVLQIYVRPDGMAHRVLVVVPRPEIGGLSTVVPMSMSSVSEDDLLVRLRTLSNGGTQVGILP